MIVLNTNDNYRFLWAMTFEFHNQPPLVIESHRVLLISAPLEFLKMQRLESVESSFILDSSYLLHTPPKGFPDRFGVPAVEIYFRLKALEKRFLEAHVHIL